MHSRIRAGSVITLLFFIIMAFSSSLMAQSLKRYSLTIAAQPVGDAIVELALALDLNIVYLTSLAKDKRSQPLNGDYTLAEALTILLKDSGLKATIVNSRVIQIERIRIKTPRFERPDYPEPPEPEPELPPGPAPKTEEIIEEQTEVVEVVGRLLSPYNLGTTLSSTKTQRHFLDTPQIVNALPEALSRDISARNYADTTRLSSSATYLERSAGVADELRLRGFSYPSLKINGIGAHAYVSPVDLAFVDSIEVAKGPGSVLFGRMEPGGMINMMLKEPNGAANSLTLRHGDDDYKRAELDLSLDWSDDTALRAIGFVQRQGDEASLNLDDADGLMLALSHGFENDSTLNVHYRFESQDILQQFGSPIEGFDSSVQFFRDENGEIEVLVPRQEDLRAGLDVDRHSLNVSINDWLIGDWSADFHLQYDRYKASSFLRYPVIEEFIVDVNGNQVSEDELTEALLNNPELLQILIEGLETISVDTDNLSFDQSTFSYDTEFISTEFTLYKAMSLGNAELEQLYGMNINHSSPESLVWQNHDIRTGFVPIEQADTLFNTESSDVDVTDFNVGLFGQWVVNWQALTVFAGARVDQLEFKSSSDVEDVDKQFTETTWRLGGVYRLNSQTSVYLNYSEAFSPQFALREIPSEPGSEDYPEPYNVIDFPEPARSTQKEFGIKRTWLDGRLQSSCAVFDIEKKDIESLVTRQENQGVECDVAGSLGSGWHITLGVSVHDARITGSEDDYLVGNKPRITPEKNLRAWLSKDFSMMDNWRSRVGVGYTWVDNRHINADNEVLLPSYNLVDVGLLVDLSNDLSLTVYVRNLLDETYTEGVFNALPYWTNAGRDRTIESRLSWRF